MSGGTEEDGYGRTGQWPSFLRELVARVPKERLHWNKKLVGVAQNSDSTVSTAFDDGTKENFDLVIGCDGTFSTTRHYVLEAFPDKIEPNPAGFWDCRSVVPIEMAKKVFGEEWFIEPKENAFAGDVAFATMHSVDDGAGLECAICAVEKDLVPPRERLVTREFLEGVFSAWFDGELAYYAKGMIDVSSVPAFQIVDQEQTSYEIQSSVFSRRKSPSQTPSMNTITRPNMLGVQSVLWATLLMFQAR